MATKNRFQIMKSVGSPSVSGAERVETLSDHTNNPEAHPDYMKKGALPVYFSGSEHLVDKLSHAINFARRAEVCLTKADFDATKSASYTNNQDNYMASAGVKRHIVTSYVLSQVLTSLGLDGSKSYIETNKIVKTTSTPPSTNLDSYVVSYGLYKRVKDQIDYWLGDHGIEATYLKKTDAALTYVTLDVYNAHTHDFMNILGMPDALSYALTNDTTYQEGTVYYSYDKETTHAFKEMVEGVDYTTGTAITGYVFTKISDTIDALTATTDSLSDDTTYLKAINGYTRTVDPKYLENIVYYRYDAETHTMIKLIAGTDYTIGAAIPTTSKLWVQVRNFNPESIVPYDDDWIQAQLGYAKTTDDVWVSGITYYAYNTETKTMNSVSDTGVSTPAARGLWCKINNVSKDVRIGYARTADTTVITGTQYYKYTASPTPTMSTFTPAAGSNPYDQQLYVLVKTDSGGGSTPYDDTAIKKELKKLGYALTVDTAPVSGITYYYVDTDGSMKPYSTAPANPAGSGAWCKIKNVTSGGGGTYTLPIASASTLGGIKVGSGLSIDKDTGVLKATGGGSGYDDTEIKKRITAVEDCVQFGFKPDYSSCVNLTISRTANTNVWTIQDLPKGEGDETLIGVLFISFCLSLDASTYCQVQVLDSCSTEWVGIQNCLSFHTYTNASNQYVSRINFTARCGSYDKFRIVVKTKSTDNDAKYSKNYTVFSYSPTMIKFVPEYH